MSNVINFNFHSRSVRVVEIKGEIWFVLKDVCNVLGHSNSRQAATRLDADEKGVITNDTLGGPQETTIINESGMYSLVLTSRKPEARQFKKWITSEVLPSIRKTGQYQIDVKHRNLLPMLTQFEQEKKQLEAEVAELRPKAEGLEKIAGSGGSVCVTDAAKALGMRRTDLFAWLNHNDWIYRRTDGGDWQAFQHKIDDGLLEHKVAQFGPREGTWVNEQCRVTPKGLARLAELTA